MSYLIGLTEKTSLPHKHYNYEIIVCLSGESVLHCDEGDFPVGAGNIVVVPPYTMHCTIAEDYPERIYINGELNQLFNLSVPIVISDNAQGEGIDLAKIIYRNRYGNPDYVNSLCNAFAHFILKNIKPDKGIDIAITEITREITENFFDSNINLSHILDRSGYAQDYIRAQFKKLIGKTPNEFLTDIRMKRARYLIDVYKTTLSLSEIAGKCGYDDYIYFSRRFKQKWRVSPQKYKNSI